ncbi:MAG: biosynthetic-type acetolactate synthase large subunit [Clostridiaceae bacterium]|nr:biosynthetic-type acetolactate synthase large subunit [Clostridiaceae bacterium]
MIVNGAESLIMSLAGNGVTHIFGYPGAANLPIYDSMLNHNIKHILPRCEQSAAHAANGYARASKKVGVCLATSGPGATNLITGIATAYGDSIPIVAITGQVNRNLVGTDAFQEVDIIGATTPFCKQNYMVQNAQDIPRIVAEAFYIAKSGRPGPVLIDIPLDVQKEKVTYKPCHKVDIRGYKPTVNPSILQIKKLVSALKKSKRPVFVAGGGVISSDAREEFVKLCENLSIPAVTTLMGIGAIPKSHPLCFGMIGQHGERNANRLINSADMVVLFGCRVGDRAMSPSAISVKGALFSHIDIDPAEIGKNISVDIPIVGDVKNAISELLERCEKNKEHEAFAKSQMKEKAEFDLHTSKVNPKYLISCINEHIKDGANIVTDVGQNQIWTANTIDIGTNSQFFTSGGLGTMGYGIPCAIGAKIANGKKTIVICGDGGFQMSGLELATIVSENLDIKIILFNNGYLGMVTEIQNNHYNRRLNGVKLNGSPDFNIFAQAYGIKSKRIEHNGEVKEAIAECLSHEGPYLLEVMVDPFFSTL